MDLKKLEQFKDQVKEIEILENRIKTLEQDVDECVADTVKASSKYFPYTEHTIRVTGVDVKKLEKIRRVKDKLNNRKIKLYNEMEDVESFIDSVSDSKIRQIIMLRYIEGWSWNNVAREVYGYPNGDTVRMSINRYFDKK